MDLIESTLIGDYDKPCSICYENGDDEYALICDGCENIFHTFCVGLGYQVPSDPVWFCSDCSHLYVDEPPNEEKENDVLSDYDLNEELPPDFLTKPLNVNDDEWVPSEIKKEKAKKKSKKKKMKKKRKKEKQIREDQNKRNRKRLRKGDNAISNMKKRRKLFKNDQRDEFEHGPYTAAVNLFCPHSDCYDDDLFFCYDEFESHMLYDHNDAKPYKCIQCDKRYGTKRHLTQHIENIHENKAKYECNKCGKGFYHKQDWKKHCRIHEKERSFKCNQCEKSFHQKSNLKAHIERIHERKVNFECGECGKGFYEKQHFIIHCRAHTGQRQFECNQCNASFKDKSKLTRHVRSVHEKTVNHECDKCGKGFYRKSDLDRHLRQTTSCV